MQAAQLPRHTATRPVPWLWPRPFPGAAVPAPGTASLSVLPAPGPRTPAAGQGRGAVRVCSLGVLATSEEGELSARSRGGQADPRSWGPAVLGFLWASPCYTCSRCALPTPVLRSHPRSPALNMLFSERRALRASGSSWKGCGGPRGGLPGAGACPAPIRSGLHTHCPWAPALREALPAHAGPAAHTCICT